MLQLRSHRKHPKTIVLENVYGAVTSNGGRDFTTLLDTLRNGGYRAGALVIDAVHFVPQSRARLFIIAIRNDLAIPKKLLMNEPFPLWTPLGLSSALREMDFHSREDWVSWRLPLPAARNQVFADVIDEDPDGVEWHTAAETQRLLNMMSPFNRKKVAQAQLAGRRMVGTLYKRTRPDDEGIRRQRAEIRFDDIAGCLRTPGGGSSRQTIVVVEGKKIRSRLLSPREAARLMGLSESYVLPNNYNEAYHLAGDGVVVPVVRHLATYILEPLLRAQSSECVIAA
jgi:DNA (cytosine-5)-methyltransferase 1